MLYVALAELRSLSALYGKASRFLRRPVRISMKAPRRELKLFSMVIVSSLFRSSPDGQPEYRQARDEAETENCPSRAAQVSAHRFPTEMCEQEARRKDACQCRDGETPSVQSAEPGRIADHVEGTLLHKSADGRGSPFPGQTYPTASVTGMPSAV